MKNKGFRGIILGLVLGIVLILSLGVTSVEVGTSSSQSVKYADLLTGDTGNNTSDAFTVIGRPQHQLSLEITNTATVTPQCLSTISNGDTVWNGLNAETASGVYVYPLLECEQVRLVISGCSSCVVDARWWARNR